MEDINKKKNLDLFFKKLESVGVNTSELQANYYFNLLNATFTPTNEHSNAYDGSLIEIVLKVLTPYAVRLNELLPQEIQVDKATLVKVCLLHHIGKCIKLIPNDNEWEVKNRGILYKYNQEIPSIRVGLLSLSMCCECGIILSTEEIEALTINDRDLEDASTRYHSSIMAQIVRQANELTYIQINNKK